MRVERGQALVEYALVLALIAIVAIVSLTFVGTNIGNMFNTVSDGVNAAVERKRWCAPQAQHVCHGQNAGGNGNGP